MLKIVARKLIAPRIELVPIRVRPQVCSGAAELRPRQRRVLRPAGGSRSARGQEARRHQQAAQRQEPEREGIDPRERHVRRADLERDEVVPEARQDRDDEQEQHERGVHRERLVVEGLVHELEAGLGQLEPDHQGEESAGHEEDHRVDQVHDPDLLVVGRGQPGIQARPVCGRGGVEGRRGHPSVLPYWTVSVPVMFGWTVQTNG
jgi:hypothetical protein